MKFWLKGNVTIPPKPRTVGGLIGWARGVNRALTELRDRKIVGTVAPGRGGGGAIKPLTIKQGTAADKFQIIPGYVNGDMPTLDSTELDAATPPESTVTETTYFWIKCVGTFDTPDTYVVTIETQTAVGVPSGTEISATGFVSFYYIGAVEVTDNDPDPDTYFINNRHGGGNLGVDSWGLYNLWWRS
jgi:hypothetical protein